MSLDAASVRALNIGMCVLCDMMSTHDGEYAALFSLPTGPHARSRQALFTEEFGHAGGAAS